MPLSTNDCREMFNHIDTNWKHLLLKKSSVPLANIIKKINSVNLCPKPCNIFNAMRLTKLDDIKCIIIGQDPYNTTKLDESGLSCPIANGLAFSSNDDKISNVLSNIYEALHCSNQIQEMPSTSDLSYWASHGVLLLNNPLTTLVGSYDVHTDLWKDYVNELIKNISEYYTDNNKKLIFFLWGKKAQTLESYCGDHIVWRWIHPSPKAQEKCREEMKFKHCAHFKDIQDMIEHPIDWNPITGVKIFTDGSSTLRRDPNIGGWSIYISNGEFDDRVIYGRTIEYSIEDENILIPVTNQRSEGYALIKALTFIHENNIRYPVEIVTDSQFYIDVLTSWMHSWHGLDPQFNVKKDGSPIKNADIIRKLYQLYTTLFNIKLKHVRSHKTAPSDLSSPEYLLWYGNDVCDIHAKLGQEHDHFGEVVAQL